MASPVATFLGWFGFGSNALSERRGRQQPLPAQASVDGLGVITPDTALQMATVWACIDLRARTIASLPLFAYQQLPSGEKRLARDSALYGLLHDSPNARMTPFEFWRAMMMNYDLRGNAYARIERDGKGEAFALWPMPADQVNAVVLPDGAMVYQYRLEDTLVVLAEQNVLHLKNLGNGTIGLSKLEFMRSSTDEMAKAQATAAKTFGAGGKPTGVLMVDSVLKKEQRDAIRANYAGLVEGATSRLMVLEANMKFQQLSMTPEDQQLLETRKFGIEELCRWFDVPPVLVHHSNVTTWGSGIEQILDGWHKLSIRPVLVSIEQAMRKRVLTSGQRATLTVEFSLDALLRGNPLQRAELYSKMVQNGIQTRAEVRQLENLPPIAGTDQLTAQTNLVPLHMLGRAPGANHAAAKDAASD